MTWSIPSLLTTDHTDTIWINPKTGCLESHPFPIHSESVVKKMPWSIPNLLTTDHTDTTRIKPRRVVSNVSVRSETS